MATELERRFDDEMLNLYWRTGRATRYWANYYLRKVRKDGGLRSARFYLAKRGVDDGLAKLAKLGRLDLSVEHLVLEPEFSSLFSHEEKAWASAKLSQARQSV